MASRSNICKYIDMPVQHATDHMLKTMRRGITRKRTEELIDTIRQKVPNIAIRTTMLVGHPGETEEDINGLIDFVKQVKFDRLGVFTYSHEENTFAHTLADDISAEEKQERADRVMEVQQSISTEINEKKIGNTYKVLIDRAEGQYYIGRTEFDSPEVDNEVLISKEKKYLRIGDFAQVKINKSEEFDLYGEAE
jgi:ribosomal protein S12 methylthiotransferase